MARAPAAGYRLGMNGAPVSRDYDRVALAIRFLNDRREDRPGLHEVAAAVGLSPFHFQRLFRRWAGLSPKRFLQVLTADEHLNAAQNNELRLVRVEAPRGPILDRRGRVVVSNVAGTAVQLWVGDLPTRGRARIVRRLAEVLDVPPRALAREVREGRLDPLTPITVKTGVGEERVDYLYEHQAEFPGVEIVQIYLREYPYSSLGAQIVGYLASVQPAKGAVQFATLKKVELLDAAGKVVHRADELTVCPNVLVGVRLDEGPRGRDL